MKHILVLVLTLGFSFGMGTLASAAKTAADSQKVCDALQEKIDEDCAHLVCDELIADGTFKNLSECTSGDDYAEAAQGLCDGQPTLEELVEEYNKKNPRAKIQCE